MGLRFGVRCDIPISPTFSQDWGDQDTLFDVLVLFETLRKVFENAEALELASPTMVRFVVLLVVSSTLNWIYAVVIVAPIGIFTPVKRIPTT